MPHVRRETTAHTLHAMGCATREAERRTCTSSTNGEGLDDRLADHCRHARRALRRAAPRLRRGGRAERGCEWSLRDVPEGGPRRVEVCSVSQRARRGAHRRGGGEACGGAQGARGGCARARGHLRLQSSETSRFPSISSKITRHSCATRSATPGPIACEAGRARVSSAAARAALTLTAVGRSILAHLKATDGVLDDERPARVSEHSTSAPIRRAPSSLSPRGSSWAAAALSNRGVCGRAR